MQLKNYITFNSQLYICHILLLLYNVKCFLYHLLFLKMILGHINKQMLRINCNLIIIYYLYKCVLLNYYILYLFVVRF